MRRNTAGMHVQCFCEAGFFGEVETRPSGLQVRTCTRASAYTVPANATFENFLDGYNTTWESGGGSYKAGIAVVNGTDVEMAMAAQTTSWVAIGLRAVAYAPEPLCALLSACSACAFGRGCIGCHADQHEGLRVCGWVGG